MITVCHPNDDIEQMLLTAALNAADIPHFIVGQHFGSLYPGVKIAWYNECSIRVPPNYFEDAKDVIESVRADYAAPSENLDIHSKIRMFAEAVFFGWFMPGGNKKPADSDLID